MRQPKSNLSLKVKGRRADGYHELQSLVVFADCGDVLSGEKADISTLDCRRGFPVNLLTEDEDIWCSRRHGFLSELSGAKPEWAEGNVFGTKKPACCAPGIWRLVLQIAEDELGG